MTAIELAGWLHEHRASVPHPPGTSLLDAAFEAVLLVDRRGVIRHATPAVADRFGLAPASLEGRSALALAARDDVPRLRALLDDLSAHPDRVHVTECRFRGPAGQTGTARVRARRVRAQEQWRALVGVEDVTAIRLLAEELRQAQKMEELGRLSAGLAHDFNNVLTVVLGCAELLLLETGEQPATRQLIGEIRTAARRACALSRHLLTFSRKQLLPPRVLDVDAVVADLEPMLARLLGEQVAIVSLGGAARGSVLADPASIEQVVINLAVNARDAMPGGGTLTITTSDSTVDAIAAARLGVRAGACVELSLADTGTGMDAATLAHIFDPFFTTKAAGAGTGLGLTTVQQLVRQLGGGIDVASRPGAGTTVRVYLPTADGRPETRIVPPPATNAGAGETVLLVEDEATVRRVARHALERFGYQVLAARHGLDALRLAAAHEGPIHLLATDVVMPELGGPDLAAQLIAQRPGTAVLFMSGYTGDEPAVARVAAEGLPFLQKPFTGDALARAVRDAIEGARAGVGGGQ